MSDNIAVTPGSGASVAADNIGGNLVQRIKAGWGADGSYNDPSAANPFPVTVISGDVTFATDFGLSGKIVTPVVTVSTSPAYTAGDVVGGLLTITGALRSASGTAVLTDVYLHDTANQKAAMTLLIFDSQPSASIADNAAYAWNSSDPARLLAKVNIAGATYETIASQADAHVQNIGATVWGNGTANLFVYMFTTGTPTYAATTNLTLRLKFANRSV